MKRFIVLSIVLFITILGCKDQKYTWEIDDELIREYLKKNNIEATAHSSGMYYIIEKQGTGKTPTIKDNVEVRTLGYYLDSTVFQDNTNPVRLAPLSKAFQGWQYGIPLFKVGGKGKLFLPRHLADQSDIMIFDVELLNVW